MLSREILTAVWRYNRTVKHFGYLKTSDSGFTWELAGILESLGEACLVNDLFPTEEEFEAWVDLNKDDFLEWLDKAPCL